MARDFVDRGAWILPTEGTMGNKSTNLHANTAAIESAGGKVPRSLAIPYEFLQDSGAYQFMLEQIDRYFPGWKRVFLRSDAPDEDTGYRFPGLYETETLWHNDKNLSYYLFERVIKSYHSRQAQVRRRHFGFKEQGMGILVQPEISNTGNLDADYAGSFSDIGELALLTLNDPKYGERAMISPPQARIWVDGSESGLAGSLRKIADSLPKLSGKGWELEFVKNKEGLYIVQTTPILKHERIDIPENSESMFYAKEAIGTGRIVANGILLLLNNYGREDMSDFNKEHGNYCVIGHHRLFLKGGEFLHSFFNASIIIDLYDPGYEAGNPLSAHMRQYMREGRVAVKGRFKEGAMPSHDPSTVSYSSSHIEVIADEISNRAVVNLLDPPIFEALPRYTQKIL